MSKRQDWSLEQDVVGYSAAISASGVSQWSVALSLFDQMESIAPNVVTYTAVMGACGKAQLSPTGFICALRASHVHTII